MDKEEIDQLKTESLIIAIDALIEKLPDLQPDRKAFLETYNALNYLFSELRELSLPG